MTGYRKKEAEIIPIEHSTDPVGLYKELSEVKRAQTLHAAANNIQRHIREPPRKRAYQSQFVR